MTDTEASQVTNGQSPWVERVWIGFLQVAPLRTYTRMIRVASTIPLPSQLRRPVFGRIATMIGIDLTEAERGISDYRCFRDLFTRRLQAGLRPVDMERDTVVAPVDGCLSSTGVVRHGGMIQAKDIHYPLSELVASQQLAEELQGGTYFTIYLRPRDYHRIHSPVAGRITAIRRIGGTLFPVKPYMVRNFRGLFTRNERVVIEIQTELGMVAVVCVAAAGVGNISTIHSRDDLQGDRASIEKGHELAAFNLGSTVIVIVPPGQVDLESFSTGQFVKVGQVLARGGHRTHERIENRGFIGD